MITALILHATATVFAGAFCLAALIGGVCALVGGRACQPERGEP